MTVEHPGRPGRPRLVLDSGVYVSAAISGVGAPAQLLGAAIEGRVVLLVSALLVGELREVLSRPKLATLADLGGWAGLRRRSGATG